MNNGAHLKTNQNTTIYDVANAGLIPVEACSDGHHRTGNEGVTAVYRTGDGKVEFIRYEDRVMAYVASGMGYPAYYPASPVQIEKSFKAMLMDLDGTTVHSEHF